MKSSMSIKTSILGCMLLALLSACEQKTDIKTVEYYYAHIAEANAVVDACIKKGVASMKSDANCANAHGGQMKFRLEQSANVKKGQADAFKDFK